MQANAVLTLVTAGTPTSSDTSPQFNVGMVTSAGGGKYIPYAYLQAEIRVKKLESGVWNDKDIPGSPLVPGTGGGNVNSIFNVCADSRYIYAILGNRYEDPFSGFLTYLMRVQVFDMTLDQWLPEWNSSSFPLAHYTNLMTGGLICCKMADGNLFMAYGGAAPDQNPTTFDMLGNIFNVTTKTWGSVPITLFPQVDGPVTVNGNFDSIQQIGIPSRCLCDPNNRVHILFNRTVSGGFNGGGPFGIYNFPCYLQYYSGSILSFFDPYVTLLQPNFAYPFPYQANAQSGSLIYVPQTDTVEWTLFSIQTPPFLLTGTPSNSPTWTYDGSSSSLSSGNVLGHYKLPSGNGDRRVVVWAGNEIIESVDKKGGVWQAPVIYWNGNTDGYDFLPTNWLQSAFSGMAPIYIYPFGGDTVWASFNAVGWNPGLSPFAGFTAYWPYIILGPPPGSAPGSYNTIGRRAPLISVG